MTEWANWSLSFGRLGRRMPRAFAQSEKDDIRDALLRVGLAAFERLGVRAARVEDICREVGIAKGSFYAFFPSKEELFMAIVEEREALHYADMMGYLAGPARKAADRAAGFFDMIVAKMETDPVLELILRSGEIPHLIRKLGPERFAQGQARDEAFAEAAARAWTARDGTAIVAGDLLGLMTIILSLASQRKYMTQAQYRPAMALMRELFVVRLVGETP